MLRKLHGTEKIKFDNKLMALKIVGTFDKIELVNISAQKKPYPSIEEVIEQAVKYSLQNISGTIVGWYAPDFMGASKIQAFTFISLVTTYHKEVMY